MEKQTVEMALLLDFYGELLTVKQREYMELYYNEDFSLTEIARLGGITPQGVRDAIRRGAATLTEMEEKTGFMARSRQIAEIAASSIAGLGEIEARVNNAELAPLFEALYKQLETLQ